MRGLLRVPAAEVTCTLGGLGVGVLMVCVVCELCVSVREGSFYVSWQTDPLLSAHHLRGLLRAQQNSILLLINSLPRLGLLACVVC